MVSLSGQFEIAGPGLRLGPMFLWVKMGNRGSQGGSCEVDLNWDGEGREVGGRGSGQTRYFAPAHMYRHRLRLAFAQQWYKAHKSSAYGA